MTTGHHHHHVDSDTRSDDDNACFSPYYGPRCYDDHDLSFWQQFREVLRELRAELQPEAIAARLDAWLERQQR